MEKPTEYTLTWEVTDEMTAKRIGSAGSKILSTPNMVALMEAAALELAKAYLDEGMTTVGAEIHCRHLAPTPVGMKVSATARLRSIERRKMWFDLEVFDENTSIFNPITIEDYTGFQADQQGVMEEKAIQGGLLTQAKDQAETAIGGLITPLLQEGQTLEITVANGE